ncbi:response regulator transcription factor [Streptomyces sp. NPDC007856]|uniref:helix-turn-helix transcriptional regulator n=1 Tax=Streptomyces sp. NPDC007856 TaxID=3364781 RepID=UPI003684DEC9
MLENDQSPADAEDQTGPGAIRTSTVRLHFTKIHHTTGDSLLKVGIFDRSPIFTTGLMTVLTSNGLKPTVKQSSAEDMDWRADVFVVDPEAVQEVPLSDFITEAARIAPVVLLLQNLKDTSFEQYSRYGVQGVVHRQVPPNTLVKAICTVASGGQFWGEAGETPGPPQAPANERAPISPRERQVLLYISRGLTHSQIARELGISSHTVDTYVKRIRQKLDLGNKAELTRAALSISHQASSV